MEVKKKKVDIKKAKMTREKHVDTFRSEMQN